MRVLFLTLYPEVAASARYRVHQFLPALREAGIVADVACAVSERVYRRGGRPFATIYHSHEIRRRALQIRRAADYDVVVVQKGILSGYLRGMELALRRHARRLVLDIDDAVHLHPPNGLPRYMRGLEDREQVKNLMAIADAVWAGNAWLCDETRAAGGNPVEFPTVVDTDRFVPADRPPDLFRIGWMGSPSTSAPLMELREAFASADYDEICMIGLEHSSLGVPKAIARSWSYEWEVRDLQSFSVGVMPMRDEPWWLGKCALKALQYMSCGVPCVAAPVGAVRSIIAHGENGLLAASADEWRGAIETLRAPEERSRLGAAGRATVEDRFSLRIAAPRMIDLLKTVGA